MKVSTQLILFAVVSIVASTGWAVIKEGWCVFSTNWWGAWGSCNAFFTLTLGFVTRYNSEKKKEDNQKRTKDIKESSEAIENRLILQRFELDLERMLQFIEERSDFPDADVEMGIFARRFQTHTFLEIHVDRDPNKSLKVKIIGVFKPHLLDERFVVEVSENDFDIPPGKYFTMAMRDGLCRLTRTYRDNSVVREFSLPLTENIEVGWVNREISAESIEPEKRVIDHINDLKAKLGLPKSYS